MKNDHTDEELIDHGIDPTTLRRKRAKTDDQKKK